MAEPYIGEIRLFAGDFAPAGWLFCDGRAVLISEFESLFNLIGTTYGGNGTTKFRLPDLRGRVAIGRGRGQGRTFNLANKGGAEMVTLGTKHIPPHGIATSSAASTSAKPDVALAAGGAYAPLSAADGKQKVVGKSMAHNNMPPYLPMSFIISTYGIFPSPQ